MSYAIVGFGKIGQALAHAFARNNINVTVASRRPRRWRLRLARLDPLSSPSRSGMRSGPTRSSSQSRSESIVKLLVRCRVGRARRSSTQ